MSDLLHLPSVVVTLLCINRDRSFVCEKCCRSGVHAHRTRGGFRYLAANIDCLVCSGDDDVTD